MPWVLRDYVSSAGPRGPSDFRDLSKPIGALGDPARSSLMERYETMPPGVPGCPPPFIYGTHYSTPGYVLNYLVRARPELMLCLQNGRFDAPDRLFADVAETWRSVMSNPADVKELIRNTRATARF